MQRTLTTNGLKDLALNRGVDLVQWTLTTNGLKDLPLIGGFCLPK